MTANVQPIVAQGQHLIRADVVRSVPGMARMERDEIKAQFSERLNLSLDKLSIPEKRRRSWLAKNCSVSGETARKWLSGLAIPDQTNLSALADHVKQDPAWLHADVTADHHLRKLLKLWIDLTEETRAEIYAYAQIKATLMPAAKKAQAQGRDDRDVDEKMATLHLGK